MANQLGMVFSKLDCKPRWRERLPELAIPTLVVHGRRDPFFPVGNGEALAREIPGARLLVLEQAATAIPDAAAGEVAAAMLELQALTVPAAPLSREERKPLVASWRSARAEVVAQIPGRKRPGLTRVGTG